VDDLGVLLLGVDTGGTFTDAVVFDEARGVVAKAKAPTTHHDLAIGVAGAIDAVLATAGVPPERIELVSLSTTLATNALVEGKGRSVGTVIIGFEAEVLERAGLTTAVGGDPVVIVAGGHDSHGHALAPVDLMAVERWLDQLADLPDAFAVTAQFSTRNNAHELAVRDLVRRRTGRPVTCSHDLSDELNGPKRAVTAVLNARLIAVVDELVSTTESVLKARGITANLMVVRGDGSLVSAAFVRDRPIETILSGPAASVVGAAFLTGLEDAVISDIGGTTTDIAVLRGGVPEVSAAGATVGGHSTMVTAVAMHTHGLGGDSHVQQNASSAGCDLVIGPRRVLPVSAVALRHHEAVHYVLDEQLLSDYPGELDGSFAVPSGRIVPATLDDDERAMLAAIGTIAALSKITKQHMKRRVFERLIRLGLVEHTAFTPTDAAHVLERQQGFDREAAVKAATLLARQRDRLGKPIAADAHEVSAAVIDRLVTRSSDAVLAAALVHDGLPAETVQSRLVQDSFAGAFSAVAAPIGLALPLIGLGASARAYYPAVAARLRTDAIIPEHADVANAVGAVVGRVRITRHITVTSPTRGEFIVHAPDGPLQVLSLDAARSKASMALVYALTDEMAAAGADDYDTVWDWHEQTADMNGQIYFAEGTLTATATGRPRLGS
jgi:N-methylhydantoinase A/oxoprolinase/acetone carboxylase beta subunit